MENDISFYVNKPQRCSENYLEMKIKLFAALYILVFHCTRITKDFSSKSYKIYHGGIL